MQGASTGRPVYHWKHFPKSPPFVRKKRKKKPKLPHTCAKVEEKPNGIGYIDLAFLLSVVLGNPRTGD